jgi:ubiquinone/menaquinone biosynthesis C-methylase UbiE
MVGSAYDARAEEYVKLFGDVSRLAVPDRELIGCWRDSRSGLLLDAGCGPGHWTSFLHENVGARVLGLDLSERFLVLSRKQYRSIPFVLGSLDALPLGAGSVNGILAWYSIIHTPPTALPATFLEFRRVLEPGGSVLIGFFDGAAAQPFPHAVTTAYFWSVPALAELVATAGFAVLEHHQRHDEGHRPHAALIARALPSAHADTSQGDSAPA